MVVMKVQELPASQSLSSKGCCAGLFTCGYGGKEFEGGQGPKRLGR